MIANVAKESIEDEVVILELLKMCRRAVIRGYSERYWTVKNKLISEADSIMGERKLEVGTAEEEKK